MKRFTLGSGEADKKTQVVFFEWFVGLFEDIPQIVLVLLVNKKLDTWSPQANFSFWMSLMGLAYKPISLKFAIGNQPIYPLGWALIIIAEFSFTVPLLVLYFVL
jgi:hypothetical protein